MFNELIQQKNNLHHAYLLGGNQKNILSEILIFLKEELNFTTQNNPDFWNGSFDTFGINDGRKINNLQNKKSFTKGKKIFIITTNFITIEAQNSLLKMFEEPTPDTHFFLIMNSGEALLPTLKSRLMSLKIENRDTPLNSQVKDFLKMSIGERIKFIQKFIGDTKKKIPADKGGAIEFLNQLEKALYQKTNIKNSSKKEIIIFEEILKCRNYLNDRSPSVKNLLEHIALII